MRDDISARSSHLSSALFIGLNAKGCGQRLGEAAVEKTFWEARTRSGIQKHLTPHSCRHGFATELADNGAKIHHLQEMLGHANVSNTMIYIHSKDAEIESEYRKFRAGNLVGG